MPADPATALSSLLRSASITDHSEVLKAANAALKASKTDTTAQHTRVVALLKLDRFEDALRALADAGSALEAQCGLEKAYALYKTGALADATEVLKSAGGDAVGRGLTHMAAQVAYRDERFEEASGIYDRLLGKDAGEEESDIKINARAVIAQALLKRTLKLVPEPLSKSSPPDAFEMCYNEACARIGQGDLQSAAALLQRALRLCDASDELTQEDKHAEMRPILLQQAYVYARMGKTKEATDLYQTMGVTTDNDVAFTVVAENNLSAMDEKPANPYLIQRQAETWLAQAGEAKLFSHQSNLLTKNAMVLNIKAHKYEGVAKRIEKTLAQSRQPNAGSDINALSALYASAMTQGASDKAVIARLKALSKERPKDVGLALSIAQVHVQQNHAGAALSFLLSFLGRLDECEGVEAQDVRYSSGLVALTVALLRGQGRETSARAELVKAAKHWHGRPASSATSLLTEAGIELSRSSNAADLSLAGVVFEKLLEDDASSHIASTGLVAALAPSNPEKVQRYITDLPRSEALTSGVDIQSLISAGVATAASATSPSNRKRPAPDSSSASKQPAAKRRKRKGKLPKDYVEGKLPDPERWLPLRDRSTYRPKGGKKGKKKAAEAATQGGIVVIKSEEETLELVGGGGVKVERAQGGVVGGTGAPGGGSGGAKKKKKGKK